MPPPPPSHSANAAKVLAQLPTRVLTVSDLSDVGIGRGQRHLLLKSGCLTRVACGLYRVASEASLETRDWLLARARRLGPDAVLAHESAAVVWGLRTPFLAADAPRRLITLRTRDSFGANLRHEVQTLPARFEASHVTMVQGVRITTLARTALDLARNCSFERALVATDHALALGTGKHELLDLARYMNGWPGSRVLRPAIEFADARSESGLESIGRGRVLAVGLPAPTLQVPIQGASGAHYRGDLAWPDSLVLLEIDGQDKYGEGVPALISEKRRERDIEKAGWSVERMMFEDLFDEHCVHWRDLAEKLQVPLNPYDPEFGKRPLWEARPQRERQRRRSRPVGRSC